MKTKILLISLMLFCVFSALGQSKKSQIESLIFQKDSINNLLNSERKVYNFQLDSLQSSLTNYKNLSQKHSTSADSLLGLIKKERSKAMIMKDSLVLITKLLNDSISGLVNSKKLLPESFYGSWSPDKDYSCCNTMGCLDIFINDGSLNVAGLDWSSRIIQLETKQNYYILDILGFSEGECTSFILVLFSENNTLFAKEDWENSFDPNKDPFEQEFVPYFKCPN